MNILDKLKHLESNLATARVHGSREIKYIVYQDETPWWEISDPIKRAKVMNIQWHRVWNKSHKAEKNAMQIDYRRRHPKVGTSKLGDRTAYLLAPLKRPKADACELCGQNRFLGWHHWDNSNASMGLWVCFNCNVFAEAIDVDSDLYSKYINLKLAVLSSFNYQAIDNVQRLTTVRDGKHVTVSIPAKRPKPSDNRCELCLTGSCFYYHHWNADTPEIGVWLCGRCHQFVEKIDKNGSILVSRYLSLKEQEVTRVQERR